MSILLTTLIILYLLFLSFAGRQKAIMDLIHESKLDYKGIYYTLTLMQSTKDRNSDGKISYWERTFPKDAWHRAERWRVFSNSCIIPALTFSISYLLCDDYSILKYIIYVILILVSGWCVFNGSFSYYYDGTRNGKKLI